MKVKRKKRITDFNEYIFKNINICKKTACWNWQKSKDPAGYGQCYDGNKRLKAHRLSYLIFIGEIPNDKCICHTCDNPGCVNPKHLFCGTLSDNMRDMVNKGRNRPPKGEKNKNSKLTWEKVHKIRKLFADNKYDQPTLAKKYNVSQVSISNVILNKSWKN